MNNTRHLNSVEWLRHLGMLLTVFVGLALASCPASAAVPAQPLAASHSDDRPGIPVARLWPVAALFAVVLLGLVAWNWKLAREIRDRKQAEEVLRHTQAMFKAITEDTPDAVYVKDIQGRYLMLNTAAARIVGKPCGEVLGKDDTALFAAGEARQVMDGDRRVVASGSVQTYEDVATNGGVTRTFLSTKGPVRDVQGKVIGLFGISRDITERKEAENKARQSHDLLANLARLVPGVIYQYRLFPDGRSAFPYSSPGMNDIYEVTPAEVREDATPVFGRLHPDDYVRVGDLIQESARTLRTFYCEFRVVLPRQGLRWRWSQAQPERMEDGSTLWHGIISDITDRKQAEDALRQSRQAALNLMKDAVEARDRSELMGQSLRASEERYRSLVETSSDWVWEVDTQGRYTYASSRVLDMLGYRPEEVLGRTPFDLMPEDEARRVQANFAQIVARRKPFAGLENTNRHRDGRLIILETNGTPILSPEGALLGYRGMDRNITARKQAEAALEASNRDLQQTLQELQANQAQMVLQARLSALGQLASGIAHDFNNALMPIVGYSELLLSNPERLNNRGYIIDFIGRIQNAANDAKQIVRRIRLIHQPDTFDTFRLVDVAEVTRAAMLLTVPRWETDLGAKGIRIRFATDLETPIQVLGDASQLREALTNLILNAVDAMPQGGVVTLSATLAPPDAVLSISDTGMGMTEEVKAHCLEAFYTTKGAHGSGLGLAMVAGIVDRHKGKIEIDSAPGRGTTIRLRLPAMEAAEPTARHTFEKAAVDATPSGLRILVAEDDDAGRELLEEYLKIDGHTAETVQNGIEAMEKLSTGIFDLVITDRSMPGANGDEVARATKIRQPGTPVILLTGFGDLMLDAGECPPGVDLVLSKPISIEDLQRGIRKVITGTRLTRPAVSCSFLPSATGSAGRARHTA